MNKVYNYLGLAQRAGRVVSGEQAVGGSLTRKKIFLVLIAIDASSNTRSRFISLAQRHGVKYEIFGEKSLLGHAIGKSPRAVVGILDRNFANVIQTQIEGSVQKNNKE